MVSSLRILEMATALALLFVPEKMKTFLAPLSTGVDLPQAEEVKGLRSLLS